MSQFAQQVWNGPKISKYGNKHLGIYDLQLNGENLPVEIDLLTTKLRYNEFRRLIWKDHIECYQFICPISNDDIKAYRKGLNNLKKTTQDIIDYATSREEKAKIQNQFQVKNRNLREQKWKKWYQKRMHNDQLIESQKLTFLQEKVDSVELKYEHKLLPFQVSHCKTLKACLEEYSVALDASDTGTGKTYSALCLAAEMNLMPIVVCPKSIIPGWKRAMKHFDIEEFYVSNYEQYRNGNTPYLRRTGSNPIYEELKNKSGETKTPVIKSWQRYEQEKEEKRAMDNLSRIPKQGYQWNLDPRKHLLIFDECHKTKNCSTLNYAIYWWAKQLNMNKDQHKYAPKVKILSLSATVADKISNAYSICYMLSLIQDGHSFNLTYNLNMDKGILKDFGYEVSDQGFYKFNHKYQEIKNHFENEDTNLNKLHNDLFPLRGSRMIIDDLGDAFPENFIEAQTYDMDSKAKQIQKIYMDMEKSILEIKAHHIAQRQQELNYLEDKGGQGDLTSREINRLNELRKEKTNDKDKLESLVSKLNNYGQKIGIEHLNKQSFGDDHDNTNSMLTVMLRARQKVELLKVDTIKEQALEFLEQKKSVVIFVNFVETLEYLYKHLQTKLKKNISIVKGGQSTVTRQRQIDLFQSNQNRLIILTMGSGRESISLHDTEGHYPRVSLISPSWSAQDLIQALGRIHRAEGKSKCLQYLIFCANTIEDRICEVIQNKIKTINAINDGDLTSGISFFPSK